MKVSSCQWQKPSAVFHYNGRIRRRLLWVSVPLTVLLIVTLRWLWIESGLARESALRTQCNGHIAEIMYAIAEYHHRIGEYPGNIVNRDGKVLLSWRVEILRIYDPQLFGRFVITEPWDSDKNARLLDEMPSVFSCPSDPKAGMTSFTSYCLIGDASTQGLRGLDPFANGSDLVLGECAGSDIPWTKPNDEVAFIESLTIVRQNAPRISSYHTKGAWVAQLNCERTLIRRQRQSREDESQSSKHMKEN